MMFINPHVFRNNADKINRIPEHLTFSINGDILPITADGVCTFLTDDYQCGIYEERPEICKNFGKDERKCNRCPYMDSQGNTLPREKRKKIKREVSKFKNIPFTTIDGQSGKFEFD